MKLLEFPHSHYCEAARWALDHKNVDYQRVALQPGLHMPKVRRIAPKTSVPVLINGKDIIQGSRQIIDYSDAKFDGPCLMPEGESDRAQVAEIEKHADKNIGIPLRAIIYNRLLDDRAAVQQCFMQNSGGFDRLMFRMGYPVLKRVMRHMYIPNQDYIVKAKEKFEDEICKLDAMLAGREFLVGDKLSRADIMVASLLSVGVLPKEHTSDWPDITHPELIEFRAKYIDRPSFAWVRHMYARHRHGARA